VRGGGRKVWLGAFMHFVELTRVCRLQDTDSDNRAMLDAQARARTGRVTDADLKLFNAQRVDDAAAHELANEGALWIAPTNAQVRAISMTGYVLGRLRRHAAVYLSWAVHTERTTRTRRPAREACEDGAPAPNGTPPPAIRRELLRMTHTRPPGAGGRQSKELPLDPLVILQPGAYYLVTQNLDVVNGLTNNTRVRLVGVRYTDPSSDGSGGTLPVQCCDATVADAAARERQGQVPVALIAVPGYRGKGLGPSPDGTIVALGPRTCTVSYNGTTYVREQLPLAAATAVTIHKAQGMQAKKVVITANMGGWATAPDGMMYVAVSRLADRRGLYVHDGALTRAMFRANPRVEAEYERLRALQPATLAKAAAYRARREGVAGSTDAAVATSMEIETT
jgi:hypothetical protein